MTASMAAVDSAAPKTAEDGAASNMAATDTPTKEDSKAVGDPESIVLDNEYDLTAQTGSHLYMAPEVFKGLHYNHKADVFSFAMVCHELLHRRLTQVGSRRNMNDRHGTPHLRKWRCVASLH